MKISFEIVKSGIEGERRLLIYVNEKDLSYGFKCTKAELNGLYASLREMFEGDNNIDGSTE